MLITFSSPASGSITMFGDVGKQLIKMMGHSGTVPGAIAAEGVASALKLLQQQLAAHREDGATNSGGEYDSEPAVTIGNRALPLVKMLESAAAEECEVMWRSGC